MNPLVAFILSYGKDSFVNDMYVHVIRHAVIVSSYWPKLMPKCKNVLTKVFFSCGLGWGQSPLMNREINMQV